MAKGLRQGGRMENGGLLRCFFAFFLSLPFDNGKKWFNLLMFSLAG